MHYSKEELFSGSEPIEKSNKKVAVFLKNLGLYPIYIISDGFFVLSQIGSVASGFSLSLANSLNQKVSISYYVFGNAKLNSSLYFNLDNSADDKIKSKENFEKDKYGNLLFNLLDYMEFNFFLKLSSVMISFAIFSNFIHNITNLLLTNMKNIKSNNSNNIISLKELGIYFFDSVFDVLKVFSLTSFIFIKIINSELNKNQPIIFNFPEYDTNELLNSSIMPKYNYNLSEDYNYIYNRSLTLNSLVTFPYVIDYVEDYVVSAFFKTSLFINLFISYNARISITDEGEKFDENIFIAGFMFFLFTGRYCKNYLLELKMQKENCLALNVNKNSTEDLFLSRPASLNETQVYNSNESIDNISSFSNLAP